MGGKGKEKNEARPQPPVDSVDGANDLLASSPKGTGSHSPSEADTASLMSGPWILSGWTGSTGPPEVDFRNMNTDGPYGVLRKGRRCWKCGHVREYSSNSLNKET